jgi:hypothetical protein
MSTYRVLLKTPEKVYAGKISIRRRTEEMVRKPTKKRIEEINESYSEIDFITIPTSAGVITLVSLEEMPVMKMTTFLLTPSDQKMPALMDMLQTCATREDWDKISNMTVKEVNRILKRWMDLSSRSSLEAQVREDMDDLDDDEYEDDDDE